MKVYSESRPMEDVIRFHNNTGAPLEQNDLVVNNGQVCVAIEAVASGAVGPFAVDEGLQLQTSDLKATEDTFGAEGDPVYWDPATGDASDTLTAGYYQIGIITKVKDANGVIVFDKFKYADEITSDET